MRLHGISKSCGALFYDWSSGISTKGLENKPISTQRVKGINGAGVSASEEVVLVSVVNIIVNGAIVIFQNEQAFKVNHISTFGVGKFLVGYLVVVDIFDIQAFWFMEQLQANTVVPKRYRRVLRILLHFCVISGII